VKGGGSARDCVRLGCRPGAREAFLSGRRKKKKEGGEGKGKERPRVPWSGEVRTIVRPGLHSPRPHKRKEGGKKRGRERRACAPLMNSGGLRTAGRAHESSLRQRRKKKRK